MKSFFVSNIKKEYLGIIAGTILQAVAVVMFFDATNVVVGGVTGIAIIIKNLFDVPMWVVNALVNVPLFIIGYRILERSVFYKTLFGTVSLTVALGVVPEKNVLTGDFLVDIIIGGVLMGAGLGLIFLSYASSGGTDLMATLLNKRIKHISVPKIMAIIDGVIVVAGAGVFGPKKGIYALIAVYIVTNVSDMLLEGPNRAKLLYVISDKNNDIVRYIVEEMDRGATNIQISGAYTKQIKNMIMCVVSAKEMVKIKQIVYEIDGNAICFVGDIREAFGEGFTKYRG